MRTPEELRQLSDLLDQALDLPIHEREAWFGSLIGDAAALAPSLRNMLAKAGASVTGDSLDRGPALTSFAATAFKSTFAADERIGQYRLLSPIGQGGMGEVWLADRSDGTLKRRVALKLPLLGLRREVLVQRFERERDILGKLVHLHIARLYDAGVSASGQPYLALEYVEGRHITDFCREQQLGLSGRVRLMRQVIDAVQYAHANLVIHRDLKPSNVLVDKDGRAMLLDFGIAKLLQDADTDAPETELTQVGGRALTLSYAAPEQLSGSPVSTATDVWALGVLLYELLSGERPFQGDKRHVEDAILTRDGVRPAGVPPDLATIVAKSMKRIPAERYATANALAEDLDRWLAGRPVLAQPDSVWYRTRKLVSRNKAATATAISVLATVIVAGIISIHQAQVAREQTRIAQTEAKTAAAVQDFLESLFNSNTVDQEDPLVARSKTAEALLDEGAKRIDETLENEPKAKLRILAVLANLYDQMDQPEKEDALGERRVQLAAQAFPGPSSERIEALASRAASLLFNGRQQESKARLSEARDLLARNPSASFDARMLVQTTIVETERVLANAGTGVDDAVRLVALFQDKPASTMKFHAWFLKGNREVSAGLYADAIKSLEAALAVERAVPGGIAGGLGIVHLELGEARARSGDIAGSETSRRTALRLSEPAGPASSRVLIQKLRLAQFLSENGRPKEALSLLSEIEARLPDLNRDPTNQTMTAHAVASAAATALRRIGMPAQAWAKLNELRGFQTVTIDEPVGFILGLVTEAQILIDLGRFDEAGTRLVKAEASRREAKMNNRRVVQELAYAQIALALAQGDAKVAETVWRRLLLEMPPTRGMTSAVEAEILLSRDAAEAAGSLASRALEEMRSAPTEQGAPFTLFRLEVVLAKSLLSRSLPGEALEPLNRALTLNAAIADSAVSSDRLEVLVTLARVQAKLGHLEEARVAVSEATAIRKRHAQLGPQYTDSLRRLNAELQQQAL
ncbi:MAG: serine/threonine-protein kinase [Caldimonas sp.]